MRSKISPNRRSVLAGLSALPVLGCAGDQVLDGLTTPNPRPAPEPAPSRPPEPAPWAPEGELDEAAFPLSVQSGDATAAGALVSVHTTEPELTLVLVEAVDGQWQERSRQAGLVPRDGHVQVELDGLPADTAFRFVFASADGRRSAVGRFRTALAADGFRKLVFGATSCLGHGNPGWANLGFVAEHELDFFLLLGDTIYADNDGDLDLDQYRARWAEAIAVPALASALASTSVVALWDDHEVANDWILGEGNQLQQGVTAERLAAASGAFREALPQRAGEGGAMWRSLLWGEALELIVLDCRSERTEDRIVSDAQLAWATDRIRTSPARLKLVLVSIHATDHSALLGDLQDTDRWQGYPSQREALLAACEQAEGVVFVTGDMHYGAVQRVSPTGAAGEGLWEVAAGPSGSELLPVVSIAELRGGLAPQYEDVLETWSWTRFELDPGLGTLRVQMIGDQGEVLLDRELPV